MAEPSEKNSETASNRKVCGIVMPISSSGECNEQHWIDVKLILSEAIERAGFCPKLVSEADGIGVIHDRIIQNLYDNSIIVCDISTRNPNVMTELGIRLAFDKPIIIVKDEPTPDSFDTGIIERVNYPRDLRFPKIKQFQDELTGKLIGTYQKSQTDETYSPFLKHFGPFLASNLEAREISDLEFVHEKLNVLQRTIARQEHLLEIILEKTDSKRAEFDFKRVEVPFTAKLRDQLYRTVLENAIKRESAEEAPEKKGWLDDRLGE